MGDKEQCSQVGTIDGSKSTTPCSYANPIFPEQEHCLHWRCWWPCNTRSWPRRQRASGGLFQSPVGLWVFCIRTATTPPKLLEARTWLCPGVIDNGCPIDYDTGAVPQDTNKQFQVQRLWTVIGSNFNQSSICRILLLHRISASANPNHNQSYYSLDSRL